MRTGTIRQTVLLPGSPDAVYRALMTTKGHSGFTGAPARISPRVGGAFMAWDGYIHGKNLKLVPGKRIEQAWRPNEEGWPRAHYSKVVFALARSPDGTRLSFTQTKVPSDHVDHLASGWKESYWDPLRVYLRRLAGP